MRFIDQPGILIKGVFGDATCTLPSWHSQRKRKISICIPNGCIRCEQTPFVGLLTAHLSDPLHYNPVEPDTCVSPGVVVNSMGQSKVGKLVRGTEESTPLKCVLNPTHPTPKDSTYTYIYLHANVASTTGYSHIRPPLQNILCILHNKMPTKPKRRERTNSVTTSAPD